MWGRAKVLARRSFGAGAGLFFPLHCPICDVRLEDGRGGRVHMCRNCRAQLMEVVEPFCKACGEPFEGAVGGDFRCGNCAYRKFHFDFAIAGYRGLSPARELVHLFKYSGRVALRGELVGMLLRGFEDPRIAGAEDFSESVLVPVPLHPRRKRERGFNQAEEIARAASKELGLPVANVLRRLRYTETQVHMQRSERLHNMRGAVGLKAGGGERVGGRTVYLIDDVLTTGATAQECARVLKKEGGAKRVVVVTVCRAAGFTKPMR